MAVYNKETLLFYSCEDSWVFKGDIGIDLDLLMENYFTNTISAFFAVDFLISCAVFLVFMFKNQENMTLKKYGFIFYLILPLDYL